MGPDEFIQRSTQISNAADDAVRLANTATFDPGDHRAIVAALAALAEAVLLAAESAR
jgi:hypothetical protein